MTGQPAKAEVGVKEICEEADKYFTTGKADHYYYHNGVYDARCPLFVVFFDPPKKKRIESTLLLLQFQQLAVYLNHRAPLVQCVPMVCVNDLCPSLMTNLIATGIARHQCPKVERLQSVSTFCGNPLHLVQ